MMPMKVKLTGQVSDVDGYPSKIVVPFSKGILLAEDIWRVVVQEAQNNRQQLVDNEIAATWPDGSVKWLHCHTMLYADKEYEVDVTNVPNSLSTGQIVIVEDDTSWIINNGVDNYILSKTTGELSGAKSFMRDERDIDWFFNGDITLEFSGLFCCVFKLDGWYKSVEDRVEPFVKQCTYISIFYNSPIIKFAHAAIFAANMNNHSIKLLGYSFPYGTDIAVRHLEEKSPASVHGNMFYQWIGGEVNFELYKFNYLAEGPLLTTRFPDAYIRAWDANPDTTECKSSYARNGNMQGLALYDEFCIGGGDDFITDPIGIVINTESGVFGKINQVYTSPSEQCVQLDSIAPLSIYALDKSQERFIENNRFTFGNAHHDEFITEGRPSLHRCWDNGHYQRCSIAWLLAFRSGDEQLLRYARYATNYYSSVGMVRYDQQLGQPNGTPGSETKFHRPAAFYHCKGVLPWGGRDYGMDSNDIDADLIGHWPDPSSLLYSWLVDGNRWNRDGYKLWSDNVRTRLPTGGWAREVNTTLVHTITLYEHTHDATLLTNIEGMIAGLISIPLKDQAPGPFWEPSWLVRYYEHTVAVNVPNADFNTFAINAAQDCLPQRESCWAMLIAVLAYDLTSDITFLQDIIPILRRIPRIPAVFDFESSAWNGYNFKPGVGSAGDGHFSYQWPRVEDAFRRAGILTWSSGWPEIGNYANGQTRFEESWDCIARGVHIIVDIPDPAPASFDITIDAGALSAGDPQAASLGVNDPNNAPVLFVPRLPMGGNPPVGVRVYRDSTWSVFRETYTIDAPIPGKYEVYLGANELALCGPLTEYPELQILQAVDKTGTGERQIYQFKISQMYVHKNTDKPVIITFIAHGVKSSAFVNGHWLKPGEAIQVDGAFFKQLNIHCESDAWIEMFIECVDRYPLLLSESPTIDGSISY